MSEAVATAETFSPAKELRQDFWTMLRSEIRPAGMPSQNTWASNLGRECERYLVYERHPQFAPLREPVTPELQAIFDLGRFAESYVIRRLEDMGYDIVERGTPFRDDRYQISGKIDARIRKRGWRRAIPVEIKGLAPHSASKLILLDDIRQSFEPRIRGYYGQLQAYQFLAGDELGAFVLLNKSNGRLEFIDSPFDYQYVEKHVLQKAEHVNAYVAKGELPPRKLSSECERCSFRAVCGPDKEYGPGMLVLDDKELERLLARREELAEAKSEYEALDRKLKKALPEREEIVVGQYVVTGKVITRKGYTVEPTIFWQRHVRRADPRPIGELIEASSLGNTK